jgi:hypothetical protein
MVIAQITMANTIHILASKEEWYAKHELAESIMLLEQEGRVAAASVLQTDSHISFIVVILTQDRDIVYDVCSLVSKYLPITTEDDDSRFPGEAYENW